MEGGFGSDFGSSGGGKLDPGLIMEQVKVQIAVANAQELLQRMTDKCFRKCIGKPGGSLDNSEQGTRVRALVWEDPTCRGATGPMSHNY
ncbi:mitochondrial import inner membrane translocase subunit Tim13 isoform X2 [Balaenoptera acutorostrata]|uniref:Mitochondrial import inner membrane translocase subunit n=1 Tax=Balaenoptera acutorostrata TaxID=9767 RepID=A0ABM3T1X1_BALAC|nr:mitochondrial import inner membrane translocase subunit Tim13 isoform X2 [Balaenoptera acutorostrata]